MRARNTWRGLINTAEAAAILVVLSAALLASEDEYQKRLDWALKQNTDVWGEELIRKGGATFENTKDLVEPLFYDYYHAGGRGAADVHGLTFGIDGGEPPWLIDVADGSRIYADDRRSIHSLRVLVGPTADEAFGSALDRLGGPTLEDGFYPILRNKYIDQNGNSYSQESFAARIPELADIVAMVKLSVKPSGRGTTPKIRIALSEYDLDRQDQRLVEGRKAVAIFNGSPDLAWDYNETELTWSGSVGQTIYFMWLPHPQMVDALRMDAARYERAKFDWRAYWDAHLKKGAQIEIPEPVAINALRQATIQNLVLRFRYSLGSWDYHTAWYPRESCDSLNGLGLLGYTSEDRDGLTYVLGKPWREREFGKMSSWGEYLAAGARYFFLTHDAEFIRRNSALYEKYVRTMQEEIATDPNGLVPKTHRAADVGGLGYWINEETVCWRGMRDIAEVWRLTGRDDLYRRYAPVAAAFRKALRKAVDTSKVRLPDGSLFVPIELLAGEKPYESITESTQGSYWNLTFPYAMASGLWEANGPDMDGIVAYIRNHGGLFLGLLRFSVNAQTDVIQNETEGLLYRPGLDNVYLTGYIDVLADRDDAEHLVLSFYGKLAHGMTRNTFSEGEGSSLTPTPKLAYRWTNGAPNSTNNALYLQLLRLMLVREGFDDVSGRPTGLYLAYATPRNWMAEGKEISVAGVPTWFGPVAYRIRSCVASKRVRATVEIPAEEKAKDIKLKLRVPGALRMQSVTVNRQAWSKFDPPTEVIDLTGLSGVIRIEAHYR
jgi:hypothetical protein